MVDFFEQNKKYILTFIYLILGAISLVYIYFNCNYQNVWYDECFTIFAIKFSYPEIWNICARDVHPPLYYWMLKAFSTIFGDTVSVYRYFSALPIFLSVLVAATYMRKALGNKTAIFFMLLLLTHTTLFYPTSDIRMYSWSMFLVFLSFLTAYSVYGKASYWNVTLLITFSLAAGYTHYYALISVFYVILCLLIFLILKSKNNIKLCAIISVICIIGYLPWLIILFKQLGMVVDNYWIATNLSLDNIFHFIIPHRWSIMLRNTTLLALTIGLCYIIFFRKKDAAQKRIVKEALILILLFFAPIITGMLFTHFVKPVIFHRYMYCSALLLILGIARLISIFNLKNKWELAIILAFFVSLSLESYFQLKFKYDKSLALDNSEKAVDNFINSAATNSHFLFDYKEYMETPNWALKYPDLKIVGRTRELKTLALILTLMPHEKVNSLDELTSEHKNLIYFGYNHSSTLKESNEVAIIKENYDIVREQEIQIDRESGDRNWTLYELKRKADNLE